MLGRGQKEPPQYVIVPASEVENRKQPSGGFALMVSGLILGLYKLTRWLISELRQLRAGLSGRRGYLGALVSAAVATTLLAIIVGVFLSAFLPAPVLLPLALGLLVIPALSVARRQSGTDIHAARNYWLAQLVVGALVIVGIPAAAFVFGASTGVAGTSMIGSLLLVAPLAMLWQQQLTRFRNHKGNLFAAVMFGSGEIEDEETEQEASELQPLPMPSEPANGVGQQSDEPEPVVEVEPEPPEDIEDILAELEMKMVGQEAVKGQIRRLAIRARMAAERQQLGLKASSPDLNVLFLGPAGTFKSSSAEYVSRIYYALGLLPSGELIEEDIAGLTGKFQGHSEDAVKGLMDQSIGKTLLLDEAYGLVTSEQDDFGKKALNVLVGRMEKEVNQRAMIFAGYEKEMRDFFSHNSGLASRFPATFYFRPYSGEELVQIFEQMAGEEDFVVTADAKKRLLEIFTTIQASKDCGSFGNGRGARNLKNEAISAQNERIDALVERSHEDHSELTLEDIEAAYAVYRDDPWIES